MGIPWAFATCFWKWLGRDPENIFVGFSWSSSDEKKMQLSFQMGREDLGRYIDLQAVAETLGYHDKSVATLAKAVLKYAMTKSQQVKP